MQEYLDQFGQNVLSALPNLLTAILIFVASLYLARALSKLLNRILERRKADTEVTLLLTQMARWSIIAIGAITALQRFFDVTAFLAGLGILGFSIGFALQNILQNFAAGIILLIQQPFNIGDAIEVKEYGGTVLAINLRTTEMRTWDGRIVIIPNADVLSNPITNYTRAERRRIEIPVGVSYDSDPVTTRQAVLEAVQNVPGFVRDPAPMVVFHTFAGSSIDLSAYFWIDTSKSNPFEAKDSALELIKVALEKKGIEIPFPIRTIHMRSEK
jgi:small conductance mechanosensitive channel